MLRVCALRLPCKTKSYGQGLQIIFEEGDVSGSGEKVLHTDVDPWTVAGLGLHVAIPASLTEPVPGAPREPEAPPPPPVWPRFSHTVTDGRALAFYNKHITRECSWERPATFAEGVALTRLADAA